MSFFGSIIPPGLRGVDPRTNPADRARERRRAATKSPNRKEDEADLSPVAGVEAAEGLRSVKANENEESHEDRTEHGFYNAKGPGGPGGAPNDRPHIDVSG